VLDCLLCWHQTAVAQPHQKTHDHGTFFTQVNGLLCQHIVLWRDERTHDKQDLDGSIGTLRCGLRLRPGTLYRLYRTFCECSHPRSGCVGNRGKFQNEGRGSAKLKEWPSTEAADSRTEGDSR